MNIRIKGTVRSATVLLLLACAVAFVAAISFRSMWRADEFVPASGFRQTMLSNYFEGIKGTPADTPVYIQESGMPGGTVLLLGGTHPNEPASMLTAVFYLENLRVKSGRFIIIPQANIMGFSHDGPQEAHPQRFSVSLPDGGVRTFRYGNRLTNPIYEWPYPDIYIHPSSGQKLSGKEKSNLNRCYPGRPDGALTERLAYAIVELIRRENVDLAFDLHEASPEYPVVNAIVAHERSMELAAMAMMDLEDKGIPMRIEPSPKNLHGLSHREWGDSTETMPILMEAGNPSQGRLRGRTDAGLVLTGRDKCYAKASKMGILYIPYEKDQPMDLRVARHATAVRTIVETLEFVDDTKGVTIEGIPDYEEILEKGVGSFLSSIS